MKSPPFSASTYADRRNQLAKKVEKGVIILPANIDAPMNYRDNVYPFRQDSHFLYFAGIDRSNLVITIDCESGETILFGDDHDINMIVWTGKVESLSESATRAGISILKGLNQLDTYLSNQKDRLIHFLPPYRGDNTIRLSRWLNCSVTDIEESPSDDLIKAVVELRSIKTEEEIDEIEKALTITKDMHETMIRVSKPGMTTAEVNSILKQICLAHDCQTAYPNIVTNRGHILHNHTYEDQLKSGDLILLDGGSEAPSHYASDITRTAPVDPVFTSRQKDIYSIVLEALNSSIEKVRPGISFRDIHNHAAKTIFSGLKDLGLVQGDPAEAVVTGAHALFFPHGLGHMIGLDVHDMEDVGEDFVGYDQVVTRSKQFGTKSLRMGRALESGFVLTVEPGLYFIPDLIDLWQSENKFAHFLNYDQINSFKDFTGVRIEDNVLVTTDGFKVLGPPIAKTIEDVEALKVQN